MLKTLQPAGWPRPKGYANGMMGHGTIISVSGQIGWDTAGHLADGFIAQTAQALRNVLAVLAEAGAGPQHVARMVWFVTDIDAYRASARALGPDWKAIMGRHFPAMAVVGVTALVEPGALVEIEATAIIPD